MVANYIPFEIAKCVVENLNHQDLTECLLTCKVLNRAASDNLRETICFPTKSSTLEHFKSIIIDRITASSNTARRVKHIDVQGLFRDNHFSEQQQHLPAKIVLKTIYKYCPNIETISYGALGSLGDIDFWAPTLAAITEDGYLQHLNAIPSLVRDARIFESYYLPIAYAIRSKLKHIYIRSVVSKRDDANCLPLIFETPFNGGDPWLAQFPQLETFDFSWWWGSISLSDINAMVDCCSKSKKFNTLLLGVNTESTSFGLSQLFILPCRQVKKIKYYREQPIDDNSMMFFMRKFPELNDVNVKIEMAKRGSSNHLSDQVLCRFLRHLSLVPTIDFTIDLNLQDAGYCLASFFENNIANDIEVEFELSFISTSIHFVSQEEEKNGVCKITFHTPPSFNCSQDLPYYYECLREVINKMKAFTLKSSNKSLLDNKIKKSRYPFKTITDYSKLYSYLLDYLLLESCGTLSTLNIVALDFVWLVDRERQNLSIKELKLQYLNFTSIRDNFFKILSKRLPNLEHLLLDCSVVEKQISITNKKSKKKINSSEVDDGSFDPFPSYNKVVHLYFPKQLTIDMPYTSFRVFGWGTDIDDTPYRVEEDRYSKIYLKVMTKNSEDFSHFFVVKDDQISCLSELHYHHELQESNDRCLALEIRCKKLDFFRLKLIDSDTTFKINL